ncbi:hypothetical protein PSYMO_27576, partial [Pseudomonas amygdali pv. mori str. 301020]
ARLQIDVIRAMYMAPWDLNSEAKFQDMLIFLT